MMASRKARPGVRGTKRKWYMAVMANCKRDRSTSCSEIIPVLLGYGRARRNRRLRGIGQQVLADALATVHRQGRGGEPQCLDGQQYSQLDQGDHRYFTNQGDSPG